MICKKKFFSFCIFCFSVFGCSDKSPDATDQIMILLNVVDSETGKGLTHERVEVREIQDPVFSMRQFIKVGEYYTDDKGKINIPLSKEKGYRFSVFGNHTFGSDEYEKGKLKDKQNIIIKIIPAEKKKYSLHQVKDFLTLP